MMIKETPSEKFIQSESFNHYFDKVTGFAATWGKTKEENPDFCPFGPLLADIEIVVDGCPKGKSGKICNFCYKGNSTGVPRYMSLETFKTIFYKLPKTIGQIAFGITSVNANPDTYAIMEFCRDNGVIPNVTISGRDNLTDNQIEALVSLLGACAFSIYQEDKDQCYDLIYRFAKAGLKQQNIHYMISLESIDFAYEVINDIKTDDRLYNINAIVFLSLKPKNRGALYHQLPQEEFTKLFQHCMKNGISYGADSCGAHKTLNAMTDVQRKQFGNSIQDCESTRESMYVDYLGNFFPCSFIAGEELNIWKTGIDLLTITDFSKDVWYHPSVVSFRDKVMTCNKNCGNCCHFKV